MQPDARRLSRKRGRELSLQRAADGATAKPSSAGAVGLAQQVYGADAAGAVSVSTSEGRATITPGSGSLCLHTGEGDNGGGTCQSTKTPSAVT